MVNVGEVGVLHGLITHKDAVLRSDERTLLRSG